MLGPRGGTTTTTSPAERLRPPHLRRLTALRAGAALFVFGNHLDLRGGTVGWAHPIFAYGYTGVAFFFLLSGFVLAWSTLPGSSPWSFYVRRFARIYPSHLVTLVVAALVPVTIAAVTLPRALLNATLLQSWLPTRSTPYSLNGVSWSLSCEVAFYAVLPLLLPWLARRRSRDRWLLAIGVWGWTGLVTAMVTLTRRHLDAVYVFPPLRFGEFLLGVVAALEVRRGWQLPRRWAAVLAAGGLLVMVLAWDRFPSADLGATPLVLAVVVSAATRDLQRPDGALAHRWLVYAGQVSFAFYLVHELVILNLHHELGLSGWALDPVALALTCLLAALLHHAVERPCERRLRTRLQRGRRVPDVVPPLPYSG